MDYSSDSSNTCESDYAGIVIIGNMSSERDPPDKLDGEAQEISLDISDRYRGFNPIVRYDPVSRTIIAVIYLPHPHPSPMPNPLHSAHQISPAPLLVSPDLSLYPADEDPRQQINLPSATNYRREEEDYFALLSRNLPLLQEPEQPEDNHLREEEDQEIQDQVDWPHIMSLPPVHGGRHQIEAQRPSVCQEEEAEEEPHTIRNLPITQLLQQLFSRRSHLRESESISIRNIMKIFYRQNFYSQFTGNNTSIDQWRKSPLFLNWITKIFIYQTLQQHLERNERMQLQKEVDGSSLLENFKAQFRKIKQEHFGKMVEQKQIGRLAFLLQNLQVVLFYLHKEAYTPKTFVTFYEMYELFFNVFSLFAIRAYGQKYPYFFKKLTTGAKYECRMKIYGLYYEDEVKNMLRWEQNRFKDGPEQLLKVCRQAVNGNACETKQKLLQQHEEGPKANERENLSASEEVFTLKL